MASPLSRFFLSLLATTSAPAPYAWWKASAGVATSGSAVTSWTDSRRAIVAAPPAVAARPTYAPAGLNGQPALYFNGTQRLDADLMLPVGTKGLTILLVLRADSGALMIFLQQSTNPYFSTNAYSMLQRPEGVRGIFQPTNGGGNYAEVGPSIMGTGGLAMAITINTTLPADALKVYATSAAPVGSGAKSGGGGDLPGNTFLIGNNANSNLGLVGHLAEVMVFTNTLSDSQLRSIQAARAAEYALVY